MSGRRWAVAGGGTGGHVTPALALAERIAARGDEATIFGTARGLEARLVPEAGFALRTLPSRQMMGRGLLSRLLALPVLAAACAAAWRILGRERIEIVLSVGGYASVPAVVGAALRRLPVVLIEPNAVPGRANLYAARLARRIFVHFAVAAEGFRAAADRVSAPGIPLRAALVQAFAGEYERRRPEAPFRLLVFGGSQGARQLNEAMMAAAPILDPDAIEVFHQTGAADRERVAEAYVKAGIRAEVVAFETNMPQRYRWADLALCRSGAGTVAELEMSGLPALLVPYPYAADDHQRANAKALEQAGAARVMPRGELSGADVAAAINEAFGQPDELVRMGARAAALARRDAAERIVAESACLIGEED
ncbi:MAG: undecaprenyldiphospho-muramoylpentapeptide beta-N-acetylglucosaminyltransferase [Myxococcota bacterium]|nr:undecaprenyldiphospho-muramoylpentapeptide beta-N-acetylglucosaminyltransferase [Myxococcota bacterium]